MPSPRPLSGNISQKDMDRFWSKIDERGDSECWLWTGHKYNNGYGQFKLDGRQVGAHRLAFALHNVRCPAKDVCHSCDTPACCNPDHLWVGDDISNRRDAVMKRRHAFGEKHPHSVLTEMDVLSIRADQRPMIEIAEKLGVSHGAVYAVKMRLTWKHLP